MSELEFTIDATRTQLHEHFFTVFAFDSRDELFAAVGDMEVGLDSLARSHDSRASVYSGWVYWFLFLKGYLRFAETGELDDDNIYLDYLIRYYGPRNHDPGIAFELCQPDLARERARWRFASMQDAARAAEDSTTWATEAVLVLVTDRAPEYPLHVYRLGSETPLTATLVDGWHRLFAARLWNIPSLPGRFVREDEFEAEPDPRLAGSRE
jgi:hypothetical protein